MDLPELRVELPLGADPLLEGDALVVELAQQAQLVYRVVQESSIRGRVLVGVEGFVLALHLVGEVKFRDDIIISFEKLKHRV